MRGLYYCYCMMHICIAVLSTFHSAPAFPRTKSGAVSGDYRGCKASVVELCAKNLPSGGFAILSAFQNHSATKRHTPEHLNHHTDCCENLNFPENPSFIYITLRGRVNLEKNDKLVT